MSNGDKPAYSSEIGGHKYHGLTKRERLAMAAMQGLVVDGYSHSYKGKTIFESAAMDSIQFADALLKELDQKPE